MTTASRLCTALAILGSGFAFACGGTAPSSGGAASIPAEDKQWTMPNKNTSATRYSSVSEINTENVKDLKVAWSFSTGVLRGHEGEPLVVPLAIPLIAGPSTLATLLLLRADTDSMFQLWMATTIAWSATAAILIGAPFFYRALGERGLVAMERLMGMVLVMISVQMFLNGVATFMAR